MKRALTLLAFLAAALPALAAPSGEWVGEFGSETEFLTISETQFTRVVKLPDDEAEEDAAVAGDAEDRLVLGPMDDQLYRVVWVSDRTDDTIRFFGDATTYRTLDLGMAATRPLNARGRRYWSRARYDALAALPTMPAPDRDGLIALLREAIPRIPAGSGQPGIDETMQDLVSEKGWNPFTSKAVFSNALDPLREDPEVSDLLEQGAARAGI